jgi:hypothetical protein
MDLQVLVLGKEVQSACHIGQHILDKKRELIIVGRRAELAALAMEEKEKIVQRTVRRGRVGGLGIL